MNYREFITELDFIKGKVMELKTDSNQNDNKKQAIIDYIISLTSDLTDAEKEAEATYIQIETYFRQLKERLNRAEKT